MTTTGCIAPTRRENQPSHDISVIILAANYGYRMRSYGAKCLLKIRNQTTILEHDLDIIRDMFPKSELILVVGFEADKVIKNAPKDVRIIENQLHDETNEIEQVRLALNSINNEKALIINSDIIFNRNTLKNLDRNKSAIIFDSSGRLQEDNIGVTVVDKRATTFAYGVDNKWCHILYLQGRDLQMLKTVCSDRSRSKMYLFEALNIISDKCNITAVEPPGMEIVRIESSKDLNVIK